MTEQQAFERAVAGLASQGFTCSSEPNPDYWVGVDDPTARVRCLYNGPDGRHCAVGWLIADITLSSKENFLGVTEIRREHPEVSKRLEECSLSFLNELQSAHDEGTDPETMRSLLRRLAGRKMFPCPDVLREVTP